MLKIFLLWILFSSGGAALASDDVSDDIDLSGLDERGQTYFHWCVRTGDINIVNQEIEKVLLILIRQMTIEVHL